MKMCHPGVDWSVCGDKSDLVTNPDAEGYDEDYLDLLAGVAWAYLAAMTNYAVPSCPITVRPCAARSFDPGTFSTAIAPGGHTAALGAGGRGFSPYISGGKWYNACGCGGGCSCSNISSVRLPSPVGSIDSVSIDGTVLPRSAYRVYGGDRLVRTDGEPWPLVQDLTEPDDLGFTVVYWPGSAPNPLTRRAASVLACEFHGAFSGGQCRLPSNVVNVSRSGESYEFEQSDAPIESIAELDTVMRIYNPHGLKAPIRVASPDDYESAVPTWT